MSLIEAIWSSTRGVDADDRPLAWLWWTRVSVAYSRMWPEESLPAEGEIP